MIYKINLGMFDGIFPMPNIIVDKHIRLASEVAVKTLLVIMRNAQNPISPQIISQILGVDSIEEVNEAIEYWQQLGVLISEDKSVKQDVINSEIRISDKSLIEKKSENKPQPIKRGEFSRKEALDLVQKNNELKTLVHAIQESTGKTLTSVDFECLAALYSYYGLSTDYILMAVVYSSKRGKKGLKYVEKMIMSWLEEGIDNHEKLDNHIQLLSEMQSVEGKVKSVLGINDRALISSEKKHIKRWMSDYKFDLDMIKLAYERTVEGTGKLSFPYMDKILQNWHELSVKTPNDAAQQSDKRKNKPTDSPSYSQNELDKLIYKDYFDNN